MTTRSAPPIRVLIVEDSDTQRRLIERVIVTDPRLAVAGFAPTGEAALGLVEQLRPDVITMDVRLPGIDGISTTKHIMRHRPTPIVVVASDAEKDSRLYFEALRAGALSIVQKPRASANRDFAPIAARLCRQLVSMSGVRLVRQRGSELGQLPASSPLAGVRPASPRRFPTEVAAVGLTASTGGPVALSQVLAGIGAEFPAPVLLVQHIGAAFCAGFVDWLDGLTPLPVRLAAHGERAVPGRAYVAPPDTHLEVVRGQLVLTAGAPVSQHRPSGTVLFNSLAADFGAACIGALLTGMGDDGAAGLKAIRNAGGHTIAESESTAVVSGMPGTARALGAACESLPLPEIGPRLRQIVALQSGVPC